MSRCFPYPPPGYCRNGATAYEALIESIKLQKETSKAKAERKREKREKKEKKQRDKEKRKDEKKVKSRSTPNEHQRDLQKVLQKAAEFTEVDNKKTKLTTELLERSDLTEEHGQPSCSHKPSYSSDSTQNSNKRKRDDASLPEVATGHGNPIKIRLLKKQKGLDASKETDRPLLPFASNHVNQTLVPFASNHVNETLVSQNRTGTPVTSGRENNAVKVPETKNNDLNGLHFGRKQFSARPGAPFSHLNHQSPNRSIKTEVHVASRSTKTDAEVLHFSRQPILPSYGRPVPTQSQMNSEIPGPSLNVPPSVFASRMIDVQGFRSDSSKTLTSGTGKRSIGGIPVPVNNGPAQSEKKTDPIIEVPQKVAPTRHEKKMRKKHSKYEKLVGGWVPPVLEAQLPDDEEDWLSRRVDMVKSSSRDDVETCRELAASSLWQPCARFLVEADIHALPYTVPF